MGKRSISEVGDAELSRKKSKKDKSEKSKRSAPVDEVERNGDSVEVSEAERKAAKQARKEAKEAKKAKKAESATATEDEDAAKAARKAARKAEKKAAKEAASAATTAPTSVTTSAIVSRVESLATSPEPSPDGEYHEDKELSKLPQSEIDAFLTKHTVTIDDPKPGNKLRPIINFKYLPIKNEAFAKFTTPTPIQAAVWPSLLSGRDAIGVAETVYHVCATSSLCPRTSARASRRSLSRPLASWLSRYTTSW